MSATVCPSCGEPIDPAHAPIARIRGARVMTYCSAECADRGASAAAVPPPAPTPAPRRRPARAAAPPTQPAGGERREERPGAAAPEGVAGLEPAQATGAAAPRRARRRVAAICGAILVGGMAIAIIKAVSPSTPAEVQAADRAAPRSTARAPAQADGTAAAGAAVSPSTAKTAKTDDAPLSPRKLVRAAREELAALLKSPSMRVERVAAMALSRVGDKSALATLERLLEAEPSDLNRIQIEYALARAGVARGRKLLRAALSNDRRDVRVDAARAFVLLGDDAGRRTLHAMLGLKAHRLGAATLLARLGDDAGMKVLRKERRSGHSDEIRMRAVVALGLAGDSSVAPRLREILTKGQYEVGAAEALAALGDASAVPALTRQLGSPYLRVRAALALRRLGRHVDLRPLAAGLTTGDEVDRVSAAEAILILVGPKRASERP